MPNAMSLVLRMMSHASLTLSYSTSNFSAVGENSRPAFQGRTVNERILPTKLQQPHPSHNEEVAAG